MDTVVPSGSASNNQVIRISPANLGIVRLESNRLHDLAIRYELQKPTMRHIGVFRRFAAWWLIVPIVGERDSILSPLAWIEGINAPFHPCRWKPLYELAAIDEGSVNGRGCRPNQTRRGIHSSWSSHAF